MHGLRHTFAAVMLQQGVNERIVMRQGGWSSNRTMREIYDYIMDEDARKAQEMRDSFFDPSSKNAHENAHETE
ncbi:MAG: tyrosine-type recombinase/integrase [Oscillospiraceae bacterium]|nr:tyrosine-type recombinase/integrase [Oscillospiraceae bacterium]